MGLLFDDFAVFVGENVPVSTGARSIVGIVSLGAEIWATYDNCGIRNLSTIAETVNVIIVISATKRIQGNGFWAITRCNILIERGDDATFAIGFIAVIGMKETAVGFGASDMRIEISWGRAPG